MSAQDEIAAPALLARPPAVSPWQTPLPASAVRRWLAALTAAWRESMQLYVRVGAHRHCRWGGF